MHALADLSFWHASMTADEWGPTRPTLGGDTDVDVAIVGGGYTGLWTAYYLLRRDPTLRVLVIEAHEVGFGASGRNGGWCSALLPMGLDAIAARSSRDGARRFQQAMNETVSEVGRVVAAEGIDCHWAHGGTISLARSGPQDARLRRHVEHVQSYGFSDSDLRLLDQAEATRACGATDVISGATTPHCASVHPARLVRGLAAACERLGVRIVEHTRATAIGHRRVDTDHGCVRAEVVVRATEAFTPQLPGLRREVAPVYSLMIATEPLPDTVWDTIGLDGRPTFHDERRMVIYGQRTADNRIAFGGRGAAYHWASRMRPEYDRDRSTHDIVHRTLCELFPSLRSAAITHRWGGAVAAPRDWWCSVSFDRVTGAARAGGYVGDGVGTSNLAGRTLADLVTGTASDLVELPWMHHRSPRWEPEPIRFVAINSMVRLTRSLDAAESRGSRSSGWRARLLDRLTNGN